MKVLFHPPSGQTVQNPPLEFLHDLVVRPPIEYWNQGSGGATLDYLVGTKKTSLMLFPESELGLYLRYYDEDGNPWLSLRSEERLTEVVECNDEWYVSTGLFLSNEDAWKAVQEFLATGRRSSDVRWISASDIPEGGNW